MPTALEIANQALRLLAEHPIVSFTDGTARAQLVNQLYETARDTLLEKWHWNFAIRRVSIDAFSEPAADLTLGALTGSGVQLTTVPGVWGTPDIGKVVRPELIQGEATIIALANVDQATADIDIDFQSLTFGSGEWRLWNDPPDWGFGSSYALPADFLRLHEVDGNPAHQVEGSYISAAGETLNIRYIAQVTDTTRFTPLFTTALVHELAALIAENVTGQLSKAQAMRQMAEVKIAEAQGIDAIQGTRDTHEPSSILDARG